MPANRASLPYDNYELGNARMAVESMRPQAVRQMPMSYYEDYELGNARAAAESMRPQPMPESDYNDYELGNAREAARSIREMAKYGRGTDTMVAHVTPGDYVIPRAIVEKDPAILARIKKKFEEEGADYRDHFVGHEMNNINPYTGQPEFKFGFKNILRTVMPWTGGIKPMIKTALVAGGAVLGGPTGMALGKSIGDSLYAPKVDNGGTAASVVPQENLDTSTPNAMALPSTLGNLQGLSDIQQTSQIATQGTEGTGGVSREGQDYFVNQIRRRLNTTPEQGLLPIEGSYLNRIGVSFQPGNTRSILEGIARARV